MAGATDYQEGQILSTLPSTVYVQLHTADPGDDGASNAVAGAARESVTLAAASGNTRTTSTDAEWLNWAHGSVTITDVSWWDAASGGNCLWTFHLATAKAIADGQNLRFPAGNITASID